MAVNLRTRKMQYIEKLMGVNTDQGMIYQAVIEKNHGKEILLGNYDSPEKARAAFDGYRAAINDRII